MKLIISIAFLLNLSTVLSLLSPLKEKCNIWDYTCLTASLHNLMPEISKGVPERGLGPLNRVYVPTVQFKKDGLDVELKNLEIKLNDELPYFIVKKVNLDKDLKLLRFAFQVPYLTYTSKYNISGDLYGLPVYGEGDMFAKPSDVEIDMTLSYTERQGTDGKIYFHYNSYVYWFDASNMILHYDNLYNGDKAKSDATHIFLQQNWKIIAIQFGRPLLDNYVDALFKVFNALASSHPIDYFVNGY